jgi:DNA-binding transcriptional MerR regulator
MLIKVGELAHRTGMTVRALHHYDAIGLLSPDHRNSSGVRLYGQEDVIRLHRIQAMKVLGYRLADIHSALDGKDEGVMTATQKHVRALEARARQAQSLVDGLNFLLTRISEGHLPTQDEWLDSLEMMALYQRHLTSTEIEALFQPAGGEPMTIDIQWNVLVAEVSKAIKSGWVMDDHRVLALAWRWVRLVIVRTDNSPTLAIKLNQLHQTEGRAEVIAGVGPAMIAWIGGAIAHARTAVLQGI